MYYGNNPILSPVCRSQIGLFFHQWIYRMPVDCCQQSDTKRWTIVWSTNWFALADSVLHTALAGECFGSKKYYKESLKRAALLGYSWCCGLFVFDLFSFYYHHPDFVGSISLLLLYSMHHIHIKTHIQLLPRSRWNHLWNGRQVKNCLCLLPLFLWYHSTKWKSPTTATTTTTTQLFETKVNRLKSFETKINRPPPPPPPPDLLLHNLQVESCERNKTYTQSQWHSMAPSSSYYSWLYCNERSSLLQWWLDLHPTNLHRRRAIQL